MYACYAQNMGMCLSVSSICTQKFDEINNAGKRLLFGFSPSDNSFCGGACQSYEVGKMKLEQKTKLKLKTIDKID